MDVERTARLLFSAEIAGETPLDGPAAAAATRALRPTGRLPRRIAGPADRIAMKLGRRGYEETLVPRDCDLRRRILGGDAAGIPRLLLRVDEFPHARAFEPTGPFGTDRFRRFHEILSGAGVPYLIALMPRVAEGYLDPAQTRERPLVGDEIAAIESLARDGVAFGLHGRSHRTRDARPRHHSELSGLDGAQLDVLLDEAERELRAATGARPRVFVAPFNRFDAEQYPTLARRYDVLTGGPETVRELGMSATPAWRGEAVYLPSYPPLYGAARDVAEGVGRLAAAGAALWAPAVIHWGAEQDDDWAGLRAAVGTLARYATPWPDFLDAVGRSR